MHAAAPSLVGCLHATGRHSRPRCRRPRPAVAAQGDDASTQPLRPRKLTPLPPDFGERSNKPRGGPERSPYAPTPLPSNFGAQFTDSAAATPPAAGTARPKPGSSPFGASAAAASPGTQAPPKSPFGASAGAPASPFGVSTLSPGLPKAGVPPAAPLRTGAPAPQPAPRVAQSGFKPTLAQVIIFVSFTTITALMLLTFYVVLRSGAIHFNTE